MLNVSSCLIIQDLTNIALAAVFPSGLPNWTAGRGLHQFGQGFRVAEPERPSVARGFICWYLSEPSAHA
jgi:hypothetical protein